MQHLRRNVTGLGAGRGQGRQLDPVGQLLGPARSVLGALGPASETGADQDDDDDNEEEEEAAAHDPRDPYQR